MRAVVQRVRSAQISVAGKKLAAMGPGLLALVGVRREDGREEAEELARRLVHLRILADAEGRMNRSLIETGQVLGVVSQFTLYGDARRGRRPSFVAAAGAAHAEPLLDALAEAARALGVPVVTGKFGAMMDVELINAGPVTLLLDTEKRL